MITCMYKNLELLILKEITYRSNKINPCCCNSRRISAITLVGDILKRQVDI